MFNTLRDAVILVAIVMLVFLQSWRSAVIPLAAVPVAIVGTFGAMAVFGFSLNALTLFGLVLAVGIVVDDAIVVVEAVEHHIETGKSPHDATVAAMDDVAGPVIAVGLVLAAVFVPCLFVTGIVGQFFRQFAVTIAISTLLSAFNSLTLSPALCALLLKPRDGRVREPLPRVAFPLGFAALAYFLANSHPAELAPVARVVDAAAVPVLAAVVGLAVGYAVRVGLNRALGWAFHVFNAAFDRATTAYLAAVKLLLVLTPLVLLGYGGFVYLTVEVMTTSPVGFIPNQDKGYLLVNLQLPDSASLGRTDEVVRQIDALARDIPGVTHTIAVSGNSLLLGANAANMGTVYVLLAPFEDRRGPGLSAGEISDKLQAVCDAEVKKATTQVFSAPPVEGLGTTGGIKLMVEDRGDPDPKNLQAAAQSVVAAAADVPGLTGVYSGFRADTPWLEIVFDREQAAATGIPVENVTNDLQVQLGSLYVNDFNRFGRDVAGERPGRLEVPGRCRRPAAHDRPHPGRGDGVAGRLCEGARGDGAGLGEPVQPVPGGGRHRHARGGDEFRDGHRRARRDGRGRPAGGDARRVDRAGTAATADREHGVLRLRPVSGAGIFSVSGAVRELGAAAGGDSGGADVSVVCRRRGTGGGAGH